MKRKAIIASLFLALASCDGIDRKTPLGWCLWEIHKNEGYDCEWSYVYDEIHNHDDSNNPHLEAYYITAFLDDRIGYWYCFIECEHRSLFDKMAGRKDYSWDEVKNIDCDMAKEENYK